MERFYTFFATLFITTAMVPAASASLRQLKSDVKLNTPTVELKKESAPTRVVEDGWHSVGTGVWYEGLLTIFDQIDRGLRWEIEIEESDALPGYYRMIPYCEGSPVAEIVGAADEEYLYVDASDPEHVYCEDFIAYRYFEHTYWFSQLVPESGFYEMELYGSLEDNVIYFPMQSFAWYSEEVGQFMPVNYEGEFKIVLPGGEARSDWNVLGESEFTDGFCGPYFKGEAITTTVTVEEHDRRPGYFRLKGAFSQYGSDADLIIDATNPDFVILPYQETGFNHPERGTVVVYSHCENFISPTKCPTIEDYMETYPQYVATYLDGVISFPPDACVLHFPEWNIWSYTTNDELARESRIAIPGQSKIDGIAADETPADGPVVYYNLCGQRVTDPAPGIYIRRQGDKATKVIIK